MSSTAPTKRRMSRRSADQPGGLPLQPSKRAREGSTDAGRESEADVSSDEDVYIPSADPAASEMSSASGGELEDDDGDSDAVGAIAAHAKAVAMHNRAGGPAKWDAEAKRARYVEKYGDMTPENALAKLAKAWRSPVYKHFKFPLIVTDEDGVVYHRFICKDHPSIYLNCVAHEDSTSNLLRHVRVCEPPDTLEVEALTSFAAGSTYSKAKFRFLLAIWCARRHRPFSVVEDPEFHQIIQMMYSRADIPSRISVSRDIQHLLEASRERLVSLLLALPGKIHLCVDGWTSPNYMSFLGVTAHWGDGDGLEHVTLDFIKLNKSHTGVYLTEKLAQSLKEYGIHEKVMALTCDNADNNMTMITELEKQIPGYRGHDMQVCCFGHVLNLIVKAILSQFSRTRAAKKAKKPVRSDFNAVLQDLDNDAEDRWELLEDYKEELIPEDASSDGEQTDEARDQADDDIIDEIVEEQAQNLVLKKDNILAGKRALEKIMVLSSHVFCRPQIRTVLARLAKDAGLKSQVLIRPVRTCWNTVTHSLGRALDMQDVLEALCDMHQFNQPGGVRLRRFILSGDEWTILRQLYNLLFPFLYAMNKMSTNKHALVHEVIPYMDILTEHLAKFKDDAVLKPVVRAAAANGIEVINRYYSKTDHSIVYRIAMLLHPAYKGQYFADHEWPQAWVDEALHLVREEWSKFYKPTPGDSVKHKDDGDNSEAASQSETSSTAGRVHRRVGHLSTRATMDSTRKMFESAAQAPSTKDALEEYLASPPTKGINDLIAFWHLHMHSAQNDPGAVALGRMAMNFLTIPATSTDAERVFSRGGLTVSRLRHSLGDASIRASALLGSWTHVPGIVDEAEGVELIKTKLRESRVHDEGQKVGRNKHAVVLSTKSAVPWKTTNRALTQTSAHAAPAIKIKIEPMSDDNRPSTPSRAGTKDKAVTRTTSSAPKLRPVVKNAAASSSASGASSRAATLLAPLVRRKSSQAKISATTSKASRADKRGKRVARAPTEDEQEVLEISSDSPESEDD